MDKQPPSLSEKFRQLQISAFQSICIPEGANMRLIARIMRTTLRQYAICKIRLVDEQILTPEDIKYWETLKVLALGLLQDMSAELPGILMEAQMEGNGMHSVLTISELCAEAYDVFLSEELIARESDASAKLSSIDSAKLSEIRRLADY